MTDVQVLSMLFCFGFENGAAKQQLQKWELKFVTELEPLEGASPVIPASKICSQGVNHCKSRRKHTKTLVTGHNRISGAANSDVHCKDCMKKTKTRCIACRIVSEAAKAGTAT